ncbi:MAG: 1-(5-phosphoribosyl)-5-[(5-phosphoribosylamino)methylideneamino] imidazole-4-carboxamide isomerase [Promethearchaeota archaeon]|nr:MAG: 1-(5-phosphoribosyl)-5-[(5-phosphoribosylamino)methylideneamino] imidazole-4-carboxamide isomerase [Candidatus Lokiarchaeota archaeon]
MTSFKIIPVIDVLKSKAVHAVGGERSKYTPIKSPLFKNPDPFQMIMKLVRTFNFSTFYIADLDSIQFEKPNHSLYSKILEHHIDVTILLDPGIKNEVDFTKFPNTPHLKLILGLETIESLDIIKKAIKYFGKNRILISLDMYKGHILSKSESLKKLSPLDFIKESDKWDINELILLDLFRVGQKIGGIPPLYDEINKNFNGRVLVGGGIKNVQDLLMYKRNNFTGVLIATALYDGSITKKDIESLR